MPKVPYPYEVNGKLVTGNGSLIPIFSLSNSSLMSSLTVLCTKFNVQIRAGQHVSTHANIEGFGLTTLSGDRHGYMPPLLKTKNKDSGRSNNHLNNLKSLYIS